MFRGGNKRGQTWQMVDPMEQDANHERMQEIRMQMAVLQRELDGMSGQRLATDHDVYRSLSEGQLLELRERIDAKN